MHVTKLIKKVCFLNDFFVIFAPKTFRNFDRATAFLRSQKCDLAQDVRTILQNMVIIMAAVDCGVKVTEFKLLQSFW